MHDKYTANTYQIQKIPINTRKNTRIYIIFQFVSKNTNYYDFWFRVKESGKSEGSSVINPPGFGLGELLCLGCGVDGTWQWRVPQAISRRRVTTHERSTSSRRDERDVFCFVLSCIVVVSCCISTRILTCISQLYFVLYLTLYWNVYWCILFVSTCVSFVVFFNVFSTVFGVVFHSYLSI